MDKIIKDHLHKEFAVSLDEIIVKDDFHILLKTIIEKIVFFLSQFQLQSVQDGIIELCGENSNICQFALQEYYTYKERKNNLCTKQCNTIISIIDTFLFIQDEEQKMDIANFCGYFLAEFIDCLNLNYKQTIILTKDSIDKITDNELLFILDKLFKTVHIKPNSF